MEDEIRKCQFIAENLEPDRSTLEDMQEQAMSYINYFNRNIGSLLAFEPEKTKNSDSDNHCNGINNLVVASGTLKIGPAYQMEKLVDHMRSSVFNDGVNPTKGELSYIPLGGLYASALGSFIAAVFNKCLSHHFAAPGAVNVENQLIRWTADLFGYPSTALGSMTSGGSLANLIALTTARDAAKIQPEDIRKSVVYMTVQTHSSMLKTVSLAGLNGCVIRFVDLDGGYRMRPDALRVQLQKDLESGLKLFMVVATCGTTDTGAVDPFDAIADVCQDHGIWLHVDAAYGGYFVLVDELKEKMSGMSRSDSITVDPHKTLFLPFGCSMVIVRDGRKLFDTYHVKSNCFVQDGSDGWDESADVNPADISPEMSRPFRGLRMWLPLLLHGVEPFSACLREKMLLARYFFDEVQKIGFAVGPEPDLTICIHRFIPRDRDDANAFNETLMKTVRADGRIYISSTVIDGVLWIRVAILQFRTHLATIKLYLSLLRAEVETYRQE